MKRIVLFLIVITVLSIAGDLNAQKTIIPKESIRFRVIANSNQEEDQQLKRKVSTNLQKQLTTLLSNTNSLNESRNIIKNNLPLLENNINRTLKEENKKQTYEINYGNNYFPQKEYKNVIYNAGNYESLVVTLGDGMGENFWCVLFPPLCLLEAEKSDDKVEYHILVKDIINKYRKNQNDIS